MKTKRRLSHAFTLIEVLIAFSLAAILISALMSIYFQVNAVHRDSDLIRQKAFQMRYLQSRLADVLPRAIGPILKGDKKNDFFFFTPTEMGMSGKSLVFSYDNGIDIDPFFSNTVLGRLVVLETEGRKQLWLVTWPIPRCSDDANRFRRELLLDNIDDWQMEFFATNEMANPPRTQKLPNTPNPPTAVPPQSAPEEIHLPRQGWQDLWDIRYKRLPAIVRLRLKTTPPPGTADAIDLFYMLPHSDTPILIY